MKRGFLIFKRFVLLLVVFSLLTASTLYAVDAPAMQWHKGHGTSFGNHVHEGMQTSDGGYIGIGQTSDSSDYPQMLVIKTYANGNKEWQKIIGTSNQYDIGICVAEASDGFICGGGLYYSTNQKRALVKLNKTTGNIVSGWPKYYSGSQNCAVRGIDILGDGSIVATGYKNCPEEGFLFICDDGDGFIMKTDADGNVIWDKGLSVPQGTKVRQISGGFAVASCAWYYSGGDHLDAVLIKTDSSGNETNKYHYGGTDNEFLYDFDLTSDGGYILGGHTTSYGSVNHDYYLAKVNSSFTEQWHQTFGQPRGYDANYIHDEAYGVRQTPDGGYIIAGGSGDEYSYSESGHPAGPSDEWKAYLVKTDPDGNPLWQAVYPPTSVGNTAAEYLGLTSDGGYIVFTDTDAFYGSVGAEAFGFMKIAPDTPYITPPTPDIDGDGDVNFVDYSLFAAQFMGTESNDFNAADFTIDGNVDYNDVDIFADSWLRGYGLMGYWELDTDANDSSGFGNDGTVYGAVWVDDSNRGWCLSLDGGNDYVQIPPDTSLNVENITMAAWVKASNPTPATAKHVLNRKMTQPGTYVLWLTSGTYKWGAQIRLDGDENNGIQVFSNDVVTTDWTHIAATYDGSTLKMYINGILQTDTAAAAGSIDKDYSNSLTIGTHADIKNHFQGLIDEVYIYDKALDQQQIQQLAGL